MGQSTFTDGLKQSRNVGKAVTLDFQMNTGSPCNSRILEEMEIRELQNREFQGPQHLGIDVSWNCIKFFLQSLLAIVCLFLYRK